MMYLSNFWKFPTLSMCSNQCVCIRNQPTNQKQTKWQQITTKLNSQLTCIDYFLMQILEMQQKYLMGGLKMINTGGA